MPDLDFRENINMNSEYDPKEILADIKQEFIKINARFEKIDARFDRLDEKVDNVSKDLNSFKVKVAEDFGDLRGDIIRVENTLKGEIKVLSEKVDGIGKRVDNQEFINRGVIVGLILAFLGGFAKVFGFTN